MYIKCQATNIPDHHHHSKANHKAKYLHWPNNFSCSHFLLVIFQACFCQRVSLSLSLSHSSLKTIWTILSHLFWFKEYVPHTVNSNSHSMDQSLIFFSCKYQTHIETDGHSHSCFISVDSNWYKLDPMAKHETPVCNCT